MSPQAPARQEFVILTHVRSGSSLLADLLARNGIAVICRLNIAAAEAHRTGHPQSAAALLDLADAAEDAWLRAEGERSLS